MLKKILPTCFIAFVFAACSSNVAKNQEKETKVLAEYKLSIKTNSGQRTIQINFLEDNLASYKVCNTIFGTFTKNDKTIKLVRDADGVVSGSYVCGSEDFTGRLRKLKKSSNN